MFGTRFRTAMIINSYHFVATTITTQGGENQQTCTRNWIESSVSLSKKYNKMQKPQFK